MDIKILKASTPTTQIKLLACELLSDNQPHSRKEIGEYVIKRGNEIGLGEFTQGCMTGGIGQAISTMSCEKLAHGIYQSHLGEDTTVVKAVKNSEIVKEYCEDFLNNISSISQKINYVNASDADIELLVMLRKFTLEVSKWSDALNEM